VITVDRLTLHVPPMSEEQAARLARQVAEALRGWTAPEGPLSVPRVTARVQAQRTGADANEPVARQIAAAVMREALREAGA
jgi:hypothetical protein